MCEFQHVFKLLSIMLLTGISCRAAVVTDTLFSAHNDRVIVTYDITYNDNKTSIRFLDANKKLGGINKGRYSKLSEVKVMFFDRVGNYGDNTKFTGRSVKAFSVPAYARYHRSDDGYFLINEEPAITFDIDNGQKPTLSIPVYLAHYEKKKNYFIFAECNPLKINLRKEKRTSNAKGTVNGYEKKLVTETITDTVSNQEETISDDEDAKTTIEYILKELEKGNVDGSIIESRIGHLMDIQARVSPKLRDKIADVIQLREDKKKELEEIKNDRVKDSINDENIRKAQDLIADAQERIPKQEKLPIDETLEDDIIKLRDLRNEIKDEQIKNQINEVFDSYNEKLEELNHKKTWRNILMGIVAVILGLLGFGGNQLLQNRRNAKNQKSMMDMQQSMVRRAENEARRRAQSYARNKAHQAVNQVKNKSRQAVQSNVNKLGNAVKGKKKDNGGVSI